MEIGQTYISLTEILIAGGILLLWLFQIVFWIRCMGGVMRQYRRLKKGKVVLPVRRPAVSVVVCAHNEAWNMEAYLPVLLTQDYPEYEVIVVDDASEDSTHDLLLNLQRQYTHLRTTFIPHEARINSPKKLALTLAAKAAQYDFLLLTDADCRPESRSWIDEMMKGFTSETEVVLGFGAYFDEPTCLNRLIQYDTLFNGLLYMGRALNGHPYMGVGRNLAYRKETFFRNKGFAGLLEHRAGDDDLFVNKVATRQNTSVAVTPESVTWSIPKDNWKDWFQQKQRHLSVSPNYKASSKFRLTLEPLTRGLFYALTIAGFCSSLPLLIYGTAGLLFARWLLQCVILNLSARHFGLPRFGISILLFDILLPLLTLGLLLKQRLFPYKVRW